MSIKNAKDDMDVLFLKIVFFGKMFFLLIFNLLAVFFIAVIYSWSGGFDETLHEISSQMSFWSWGTLLKFNFAVVILVGIYWFLLDFKYRKNSQE